MNKQTFAAIGSACMLLAAMQAATLSASNNALAARQPMTVQTHTMQTSDVRSADESVGSCNGENLIAHDVSGYAEFSRILAYTTEPAIFAWPGQQNTTRLLHQYDNVNSSSFHYWIPSNGWAITSSQEGNIWFSTTLNQQAMDSNPCDSIDVYQHQRDNPSTGIIGMFHNTSGRGLWIIGKIFVASNWQVQIYAGSNLFWGPTWYWGSKNHPPLASFAFQPHQCGNANGCQEAEWWFVDFKLRASRLLSLFPGQSWHEQYQNYP